MPSKDEIRAALDEHARPALAAHGGGIEFLGLAEDGAVRVRLTGACAGCPGAAQTMIDVVVAALREHCPGAGDVRLEEGTDAALVGEALRMIRAGAGAGAGAGPRR